MKRGQSIFFAYNLPFLQGEMRRFMMFWLGFLSPYIGILLIVIGMKLGGRKFIIIGKVLKKIYCIVLFTLSLFLASFIASFLSLISGALIFGSVISAVVLLFCWCGVELFYRGNIDMEEILNENDKNFCNLCGLVIVVVTGIYLYSKENYGDYLVICSIATSIWIGAYVPITKIFSGKKFRDLFIDAVVNFSCKDKMVKFVSIITGAIILFLNTNSQGSIAVNALIDEFGKGLAGGCTVILGISIGEIMYKKSVTKKEKMKN